LFLSLFVLPIAPVGTVQLSWWVLSPVFSLLI
jgi:hypothetical protein